MSLFLAPIHEWLFNKIIILENIEKEIVKEFESDELLKYHSELCEKFGDYIPNKPLEELIDQSNIHGWLQNRITVAESRQAALVKELTLEGDNAEKIRSVYYSEGKRIAEITEKKFSTPAEVFNELSNILLEGMPCDRVNRILESDDDNMIWEISQCVHKANWESSGVEVEYYYTFRESFIKGFVENISDDFGYLYNNGEVQMSKIFRK